MDAQPANEELRNALKQATHENQELREAHKNIAAIISHTIDQIISIFPQPTLVVNKRLVIKECNQPAMQWIAREKNQISGQLFSSLFPFNTEAIERKLKDAIEDGRSAEFTHSIEILRTNHILRFSIAPFRSLSGNFSLIVSFSDQNDNKYQQQERNEQIYLLTSVLNAAPDRFILCNSEGEIRFANKSAVKMLTKHRVIHEKTNLFTLLSRNKRALFKKYFSKAIELNSLISFNEKRNKRYYQYMLSPLHFSGYNSSNILIHCQEVTSQKEEMLKCSAQLEEAKQLLNFADTVMMIIRQNGDIDYINQKGLEIYKFINDRRVKKNFFDLLTSNSKNEIATCVQEVIDQNKEISVSAEYKKQLKLQPGQHKIHFKNYFNSDNHEHKILLVVSGE